MSLASSSPDKHSRDGEKRLRIAVLNRAFSTTGGGAEHYSVALVEQLACRHEIHVFAQEIDHAWPGVHYHQVSSPLPKPRWVNQLWFAARTWILTRRGFDVVHSHENTWHGNVQTVHVLPVKYNLFKRPKGWRLFVNWFKTVTSPRLLVYLGLEHFRFALRADKKIVVTSDTLRSVLEMTYPVCKEMISVITPGITMPLLPATRLRKEAARARLGLPLEGHCILFVANDFQKKGLETLLKALALCPVGFVLAIVGNNSQQGFYAEVARKLMLRGRVFFIGTLKDLAPAYEAADCLAHPTLEDTFAMVVLEAMSHSLPVVVSNPNYCGISSLLQNGINSWIVSDPTDASELHNALEVVLGPTFDRVGMGKLAQEFAGKFQWLNLARTQEYLYRTVTSKDQTHDGALR